MNRFQGKSVLVTGSSSGIGAECAYQFAKEGAEVFINYFGNEDGAKAGKKRIEELGAKAHVIQADVGKPDQVSAMFQTIQQTSGKLDVLVNNAGITVRKSIEESTVEDFQNLFAVNLQSVFQCSTEALKLMPKGGAIVNLSSIHAAVSVLNFEMYGAIKAGMEGLTRTMALSAGWKGIRINAVRPGIINVERDSIDPNSPEGKRCFEGFPLQRPGEVQDVARTVLF